MGRPAFWLEWMEFEKPLSAADSAWLLAQCCYAFVFTRPLIHQNCGHGLLAPRQSRYLHFGIHIQLLHEKLPHPCIHLIYYCTTGILDILAKSDASFVRGFMFRVKHFLITQTIKDDVAFPNQERVKMGCIAFLPFFPLPPTRCPLAHPADPAELAVPMQLCCKQRCMDKTALLARHVVWTTSAAMQELFWCCYGEGLQLGVAQGQTLWVSAKGTESLPMSCPLLDSQEAKNTELVHRCYSGGSVFPPALALLACCYFFPSNDQNYPVYVSLEYIILDLVMQLLLK